VQVDLFATCGMNFSLAKGMPDTRTARRLTKKGATTRNADRSVPKDQSRSAAWDVAPVREAAIVLTPANRVYPREPSAEARLPVRHKLYCEAPTGVADPITTGSSEVGRLYPGGR